MKITDYLNNSNKTLFSYEIIPPFRGGSIDKVFKLVEELMPFDPPFIDLTSRSAESYYQDDGTGNLVEHIRRKRPGTIGISAAIKNKFNVETVPHVLCNGFSKEETEDALIELNYLGIDNILAVRGDELRKRKNNQDQIGNKYASDLVKQIQNMNKGKYLEDLIDTNKTNFCIGVGGYPEKHFEASSLERDIETLKYKVDCGADYIVTQMFFDNKIYFQFVDLCRKNGIEIPIIPGVKILSLERHLKALPKHFYLNIPRELVRSVEGKSKSDIKIAGIDWATNQVQELIDYGVPCIHFYIMSSAKSATKVVSNIV